MSEAVEMDGPLEFETEDLLLNPTTVSAKKRKKVIGLDDLLTDHYKEKGKLVEQESKRTKARKTYNSDDDDDDVAIDEALLSRCVDECRQKIGEIGGEDENSSWGMLVFGDQAPFPPLDFPELVSCAPLQSILNTDLNSLLELGSENGESFLQGLLVNGWLSKLPFLCGYVEKSVAEWALNLLLYSSEEDTRTSACDFWQAILLSINKVDAPVVEIRWFPGYSELKRALVLYGFLFDYPPPSSHTGSGRGGPPQNIRAWIKFVTTCCQIRNVHSFFSTSEAEELAGFIILFFLDHKLQGLYVLVYDCLLSLIGYFTDEEWNTSCKKIAKSLACRLPSDLNCLKTVECISGVNARSKCLRSTIAYETLVACFDNKVSQPEEILKLLIAINLKEKNCDLFRVYIYLVLAENWLLSNSLHEDKPLINEMWGVYLRNCSFQITGADLRSYAPKVRTRASYILQGTINT